MTKLHELIAVEPDLKGKAQQALNEIKKALASPQLFTGEVRTYDSLYEGGETFPDEVSNPSTTVPQLLAYLGEVYGDWMDVGLQKEVTNSDTSATVDVGEITFNLPAPALLNLESKLQELRRVYDALPVLDPAETWKYDDAKEIWVSKERVTFRTKKVLRNHVKAEATEQHPAQVEVYTEDERAGTWTKVVFSGAVTAKRKRQILARIDDLYHEVKKARQRANDIEANTAEFSETLFDYIHGNGVE